MTYKHPLRKRNTIKRRTLGQSDEMHDRMNATSNVGSITLRRPLVSARKPKMCDEQIMPINEIALNRPFSPAVKFKSHFDTGIINAQPHVSNATANCIRPLIEITMKLKNPNSSYMRKKNNFKYMKKTFIQFPFRIIHSLVLVRASLMYMPCCCVVRCCDSFGIFQ